jgi:hypothetical protein
MLIVLFGRQRSASMTSYDESRSRPTASAIATHDQAQISQSLGRLLQSVYAGTLDAPPPDDIADLIRRLEEQEAAKERSLSSEPE